MPGERGRPKGLPKSGGRKKGEPNAENKQKKELIAQIVEGQLPYATEVLNKMRKSNPVAWMNSLHGLMEFVMPKLARTDIKQESQGRVEIIVRRTND